MSTIKIPILIHLLLYINCLIPWNKTEYPLYYEKALRISNELKSNLYEITKVFENSWCIVAPPKTQESIARKLVCSNKTDVESITDLARSSIIVENEAQVEAVYQLLRSTYGKPLVDNNRFLKPKSNGYKDRNLIYESNIEIIERNANLFENRNLTKIFKFRFEIQIHLCQIMIIKELEHLWFEIYRILINITPEKSFSKTLEEIGYTVNDFEKVFDKVKEFGNEINFNKFIAIQRSYDIWKQDKDNYHKSKGLADEINKFSSLMYTNLLQNTSCKISTQTINNTDCALLSRDNLNQMAINNLKNLMK